MLRVRLSRTPFPRFADRDMSLDRYASEVGGVVRELSELLSGEVRAAAFRVLKRHGWDRVLAMDEAEIDAALKLLSQTPSQRSRSLARLDDESMAVLLLRARYLGMKSLSAIGMAEDLSYLPGSGYRDAAVRGARAALRRPLDPRPEEVLPGWSNSRSEPRGCEPDGGYAILRRLGG